MAKAEQQSKNYPFLSVGIHIGNWQFETSAPVDTGFQGSLVIPTTVLDLGLGNPDSSSNWVLANGMIVEAPVHIGDLEIFGLAPIPNIVVTVLGTDYILGRRVIDRFEVILDHGERLIVRP